MHMIKGSGFNIINITAINISEQSFNFFQVSWNEYETITGEHAIKL
jgi:hypothetical protein